jgi:hypothetical protein
LGVDVKDLVRVGMRLDMREDNEAKDEYDAWFQAKVQEAPKDQRPKLPHAEAMRDMRELIGRKHRDGGLAPTLPATIPRQR